MHCRRFIEGFQHFQGEEEYKLVQFRKWGKIEAVGGEKPAGIGRSKLALLKAMNGIGATPFFVKRNFSYQISQHQKSSLDLTLEADAFAIEAISADGETHVVSISIFNVDGGGMFLQRFEVGPEYGRCVAAIAEIRKYVDLNRRYLVQVEPMNEAEGRAIIFGFCDFVKFKADAALKPEPEPEAEGPAKAAKLVVWDLDETLWRGVLVEDGVEGVQLRPEAVRALKALDERGVLHSIASKNDVDLVNQALKHFGLDEYFLYPQVGWGPKSVSVRNIAERLSLGIDSFVFVDDQPFERAEVAKTHPNMRILTHEDVSNLPDFEFFPKSVTSESRNRRSMYRADEARAVAMSSESHDYDDFLRYSNMTLTINLLDEGDIARVHELSMRTNQLNYTGRRYALDELKALKDDVRRTCVTLTCGDNFGAYGLIGFVVIDKSQGLMEQFFMSCRAQKKRVENAFFDWARLRLLALGHERMAVAYQETAKNKASRAMLDELGFVEDGERGFVRDAHEAFAAAGVIKLVDQTEILERIPS
jgi:FkbH-like protein